MAAPCAPGSACFVNAAAQWEHEQTAKVIAQLLAILHSWLRWRGYA